MSVPAGCPSTILVAHNFYRRAGGEDVVFAAETALLRAHGHTVIQCVEDNRAVQGVDRFAAGLGATWSWTSWARMRRMIEEHRPDVVHLHNTFPLISPSVYYAARAAGIPVVQTLHNYRLLCPSALLYHDGRVCEDCLGRLVPWPGVAHGCYRDSRTVTGVVATMLTVHRLVRTWSRMVDAYIVLTEFARGKLVQGGLPAAKLLVKPHFVDPDPGPGAHEGGFALFVGRLTLEKGVRTLLAAWELLAGRVPLKIVGDGPLAGEVARAVKQLSCVEWLGARSGAEVSELMGRARLLVVPSEWYETFGRVVIEAYARGTPVLASNLGAVAELVEPGRTGLLFAPADPPALAAAVSSVWEHPSTLESMSGAARLAYESRYTAPGNYRRLMEIYAAAGVPATRVESRGS
ncbi:MAG TPA: glycosyltransferase [Thermomicrobiaceae bacterium]|nr:glycosyltransferase [Thermomicrobiaceae bacterium]